MKRIGTLSLLVALSVVIPNSVLAQSSGMDMKSMDTKNAATTPHKGVGLVKNVNAADGMVTLAHEPIKSLNWPAMTMAYKVKDKAMLDKVKPGDKVEFTFVQAGSGYLITDMR